MNAATPATKSAPGGWWRRALRSLGTATGLVAAAGSSTLTASGQDAAYRSAAAAPQSWQVFARQMQGIFEQRLAGDEKETRAFQDYLAKREGVENAPPLTFVARTWILHDGNIERMEFDGLDDKEISLSLRAILMRGNVGAPPADMLQPVRLRLSLRPKDQSERGK